MTLGPRFTRAQWLFNACCLTTDQHAVCLAKGSQDSGLHAVQDEIGRLPIEIDPHVPFWSIIEYPRSLCSYLEPWIIGIPEEPLKVTKNPLPPVLDCGDKRYVAHGSSFGMRVCSLAPPRGIHLQAFVTARLLASMHILAFCWVVCATAMPTYCRVHPVPSPPPSWISCPWAMTWIYSRCATVPCPDCPRMQSDLNVGKGVLTQVW